MNNRSYLLKINFFMVKLLATLSIVSVKFRGRIFLQPSLINP